MGITKSLLDGSYRSIRFDIDFYQKKKKKNCSYAILKVENHLEKFYLYKKGEVTLILSILKIIFYFFMKSNMKILYTLYNIKVFKAFSIFSILIRKTKSLSKLF